MGIEWTKSRVGKWLLVSLIPETLGLIVAMIQSPDVLFEGEFFWSFLALALFLYWPAALVAGITLSVWGSIDQKRPVPRGPTVCAASRLASYFQNLVAQPQAQRYRVGCE